MSENTVTTTTLCPAWCSTDHLQDPPADADAGVWWHRRVLASADDHSGDCVEWTTTDEAFRAGVGDPDLSVWLLGNVVESRTEPPPTAERLRSWSRMLADAADALEVVQR